MEDDVSWPWGTAAGARDWHFARDKVGGVLWQPDHDGCFIMVQRLQCLRVFCCIRMPACILVSRRFFRAASPLGGGATGLFMGSSNDASPSGICRSGCHRNGSCRSRLKCFRQNGRRFHCGWLRRCARKGRRSSRVHPRNCRGGTGRATRIAAYKMSEAICVWGAMHERILSNMRDRRWGAKCSSFPSFCQSFISLLLLSILSSSFPLIGFRRFSCFQASFEYSSVWWLFFLYRL